MTPEEKAEWLDRLSAAFSGLVPQNNALNLSLVDFDRSGMAMMKLPYRADLIGNPDTGVLHGGVITTLLDATSGAAVFMKLWDTTPIATLDLRIDYLKPAQPPKDVIARAECLKLTRQVAFVRAVAYHEDPADPIAAASGTFMITHKGQFAKMESA